MIKQSKSTDDTRLMLLLLYDKIHTSSHDKSRSSIFDKNYRRMILMYEREIETEEKNKGDYSPVYFALLCNLHKNHKHPGAAMIALDQLHDRLDKSSVLEKKWQEMLHQIREMATEQSASEKENFQNLLEVAKSQESSQSSNGEQMHIMLLRALSDRILELEKIEKHRSKVKVDQQHFANDPNKNRSIFHHKMRVSLSHKFTAMAVISSGDDDEPIVKHDVTGTETM